MPPEDFNDPLYLKAKAGKIFAPFTEEQVEKLKAWQNGEITIPTEVGNLTIQVPTHPFTCCSFFNCEQGKREDKGILIPSLEGLTCPCGNYTQNWCHDYMVE